jgi:nucleotide-binding universal stress UspA family protein
MFKKIMVPVDLAHAGKIEKALGTAAMLARQDGASVTYVAVGSAAPSSLAHTPAEFAEKLDEFAKSQADAHGIDAAAHAVTSHDPTIDLDDTLLHAAKDIGADCIVVASHIPNIADHLWPSHGGSLARRSDASVFVVR